jgi:hypothetical protein
MVIPNPKFSAGDILYSSSRLPTVPIVFALQSVHTPINSEFKAMFSP